jgi:hypothetical protein
MPRWQQLYVLVGTPLIAFMSVVDAADRLGLLAAIPENSSVIHAINVLFDVYVIFSLLGRSGRLFADLDLHTWHARIAPDIALPS